MWFKEFYFFFYVFYYMKVGVVGFYDNVKKDNSNIFVIVL